MRSAFAGSHPALNFLFFASVVAFGMLFFHPALLGISFAAALSYSICLRGRGMLKTLFCFLLPTLLFVVLLGAAFNHYGITTLFTLSNGNRVTLEAIVHGFATGGMVLTVFLWFVCYNAVVTTDKFLHVFARAFPTGALLVSMTLRFVPLLTRRMRKILEAQRGIGYGGGKLRGGLHALSILITWSLENAVDVADSMKSRGYGSRARTSYTRFFWTRRDVVLTLCVLLLDALVIAGIAVGQTRAMYDPYISLPALTAFSFVLYAGYALLCFMPLLLDLTEAARWNRSR